MSSNPCDEPLEVNIRPSRLIAGLLLAIHITAALVVAQLPFSMLTRLILLLAVLGSLMWNMVLYWRRTPKRVHWQRDGGWEITDYRDQVEPVELLPQAHLGNWIVVAHFRNPKNRKHRSVMLARDSCAANSLRRMRVLLRYGAPRS